MLVRRLALPMVAMLAVFGACGESDERKGGDSSGCAGKVDGVACGDPDDSDRVCDRLDTCLAGICVPNVTAAGAPCGDPPDDPCLDADRCDGSGHCQASVQPAGTPCGDPAVTECDDADICDGAGSCSDNHRPSGTDCGDPTSSDCKGSDRCDGAGSCDPNDMPDGTPCADCAAGFPNCDVCEAGVCLDACVAEHGDLQTTFAGGNGEDGAMFDLVALTDVNIVALDASLEPGTHTVEIYTKSGSYAGFESNAAAWTLVGSANGVVSNGLNVATPVPVTINANIAAGQTLAIYMTTTGSAGGLSYTNGSSAGAVYVQDAHIQLLEGAGVPYSFGGGLSPRVFNGILHYETICK